MKLNNIYTAAFLMVIAGGCQKETVPSQEFEGKEFKVVTNVLSRGSSSFDTNKTFILSIDQKSEIGDYLNQKMSYSGDSWKPVSNPNAPWQWVDTETALVTAVHIPDETDYSGYDTSKKQSGDVTAQDNADVLYFNESVTDKTSELSINFKHLLCMIEVPVPENMSGNTIAEIKIKGVKTSYTWTPNLGVKSLQATYNAAHAEAQVTLTAETTAEVSFIQDEANDSYYCILPPQELGSDIELVITYSDNSETQTERFNAGAKIVSGGKYRINKFTYNPANNTGITTKARSGKAGLTLIKVSE